jgi:hypothetical protein
MYASFPLTSHVWRLIIGLAGKDDHVEVDIALGAVNVLVLDNLGNVLPSAWWFIVFEAHVEKVGTLSTVKGTGAAAVKLDNTLLALGVGGLDKGNKVRVNVEVGGDRRLARLGSGSVGLLEEVGLVEELGAGQG